MPPLSHVQYASILREAGCFEEAEAHYDLALAAARKAGDKELEGTVLQNQGGLAYHGDQLDRAARLYRQALQRFQEADDQQGMMQTYQPPRRGRTEGGPPGRSTGLV